MKPSKILALYSDYLAAKKRVVIFMMHAVDHFEQGYEHQVWMHLFYWQDAIDEREDSFRKLESYYAEALALAEGVL